jgi:hypothetical protein
LTGLSLDRFVASLPRDDGGLLRTAAREADSVGYFILRPAELIVVAAPIDKGAAAAAPAHGFDAADDDGMAVPLDDFVDRTIEGGERVAEQRRAGGGGDPVSTLVASRPLSAAAAGKAIGDFAREY